MKKIFLSLAAMAFLAVGTVSCSSSDDSTPTPPIDNPDTPDEDAKGAFVFDGQEYSLTNMHFLLNGANGQIQLINRGTADAPVIVSRWVAVAYNSSPEDVLDATHYYQFSFDLPTEAGTNEQGQTVYSLLFPNEVEPTDFIIRGVYAELDLEPLTLGTIGAAGISFDTFVYGENVQSLTKNSSVFGADPNSVTIGHEFNGEFAGISLSNLNQSAAPTALNLVKSGKVDLKSNSVIKNMKYTIAK